MANQKYEFHVDNDKYEFEVLSGTVLSTDQRSDTHVSGSGNMAVIQGTGTGSHQIHSTVTVTRDIWLKDDLDNEHHLRYSQDLPVREGQKIYNFSLTGPSLAYPSIQYALFNQNAGKYYSLCGPIKDVIEYRFWLRLAARIALGYLLILALISLVGDDRSNDSFILVILAFLVGYIVYRTFKRHTAVQRKSEKIYNEFLSIIEQLKTA